MNLFHNPYLVVYKYVDVVLSIISSIFLLLTLTKNYIDNYKIKICCVLSILNYKHSTNSIYLETSKKKLQRKHAQNPVKHKLPYLQFLLGWFSLLKQHYRKALN
ncbi:hypothetical protein ACJX0J_029207 [Zea mays]